MRIERGPQSILAVEHRDARHVTQRGPVRGRGVCETRSGNAAYLFPTNMMPFPATTYA